MNKYNLIQAIIDNSISDDWATAKKEWQPSNFYVDDTQSSECECGKQNIKNVCVIYNKYNNKELEVGNCCITKFLDLPISSKIFENYKKIKKEENKSLNTDVIDWLFEKNIIRQNEVKFYYDTQRKRKLSEKQEKWRVDINKRFLKWLEDNKFQYK